MQLNLYYFLYGKIKYKFTQNSIHKKNCSLKNFFKYKILFTRKN